MSTIDKPQIGCINDPVAQKYSDSLKLDTAKNNGGETDYYKIDKSWNTFQDVIEAREMNYAQGNILKVACTFNIGRHDGTTYERDLNKIVYFAQRELKRLCENKNEVQ